MLWSEDRGGLTRSRLCYGLCCVCVWFGRSLKEFLEEEKAAVEQEAELIQKGYTDVMLRLIEHQKQLCESEVAGGTMAGPDTGVEGALALGCRIMMQRWSSGRSSDAVAGAMSCLGAVNLCRQVDQIVREYESFVDDENMSPRQK